MITFFNLPFVTFSSGYSYDGRGVKLSVTYATATTDVLLGNGTYRRYRTDYVRRYGAGRVLRGDSVEMVMHPYGKLPRFFALTRTANRTAYYLADARQKRSTIAKNLDELANARFDGDGNIRYYLHDFQGNVTMVVDNEGEVLQHTRYYPYGEPIDVFAASETSTSSPTSDRNQPFLYGGKELERMHGLGEYDYGARRFQSHLPMWTTQDPCLEKYFPTSPYAYCAGNPIRFTDPTGCIIEDKDGIYTQLTGYINSIINSIISIKNPEEFEERRALLYELLSINRKLSTLEKSDVTYSFNVAAHILGSSGSLGETAYDPSNNKVVITVSDHSNRNLFLGVVAHEAVHGYQYEKGRLSITTDGSLPVLYDWEDEIEAFYVQDVITNLFLYTPKSRNKSVEYILGLVNRTSTVAPEIVKFYDALPKKQIKLKNWLGITNTKLKKQMDSKRDKNKKRIEYYKGWKDKM